MSVRADLHVHTTQSDGSQTLVEQVKTASENGVSVIAITDHDRIHPDLSKVITDRQGVTVINGIELRVQTRNERIDLLGYGVTPTPALTNESHRVQRNREERAREMIGLVEDELGIELDLESTHQTGRPHVARAIAAHPESGYGYSEAFEHVIGNGCPAYVSRTVTEFEHGVQLLNDACSVVSLAHPFRYQNPSRVMNRVASHVDAIEREYPYADGVSVDLSVLDSIVDEHDLLVTGGSDAHEDDVGRAGVSREDFAPLRSKLEAGMILQSQD